MLMDINVPTTAAGKRMLKSVSPIYDRAYTARWLFEVMGLEMEEARKYVEEFRLQAYPETATWGLKYWEQRYHIRTEENLTLEERRQRVIAKRWKFYPMNPARLESFIKDCCGRNSHVTEYNSEYTIEINVDGEGGLINYYQLFLLLRNIIPSHLHLDLNIIYGTATANEHVATGTCSIAIIDGATAESY